MYYDLGQLQPQPQPSQPMRNLFKLARNVGNDDPTGAAVFTIGFRVGMAVSLWRPPLSSLLMEELKLHMAQYNNITLQQLAEFEEQCMERIFNAKMNALPTLLDAN
jgi:hypothetical protein